MFNAGGPKPAHRTKPDRSVQVLGKELKRKLDGSEGIMIVPSSSSITGVSNAFGLELIPELYG